MNDGDRVELLARRRCRCASSLADRPRAGRSSARGRACRAPRPWSGSSGRRARRRRPPRRRCRDTRQPLKPWRANTRTAASRIMRRLSAAGRCVACTPSAASVRPAVGRRAAVGERRAARGGCASCASRSRSAMTTVSRVGRGGEHDAPRVDDHRAPAGAEARRVLADLVGGDDEAPGSRSRGRAGAISQWSRVVGEREGGGDERGSARRARRARGRARGSGGRSRCSGPARRRRRSSVRTSSSPGSSCSDSR